MTSTENIQYCFCALGPEICQSTVDDRTNLHLVDNGGCLPYTNPTVKGSTLSIGPLRAISDVYLRPRIINRWIVQRPKELFVSMSNSMEAFQVTFFNLESEKCVVVWLS